MFFIGVDLGQRQDHSAIAVVERRDRTIRQFDYLHWLDRRQDERGDMLVRHVERMALGTPYTQVVRRVVEVARNPALIKRELVVDATGVGMPVVDMLRAAQPGCNLRAVLITGGSGERYDGQVWHVGKVELLAGMQRLLEEEKLGIARKMRETERLRRELTDVRVHYRASGRLRLGADGIGEHDDLVMAVALACWAGRSGEVGEKGERLFW